MKPISPPVFYYHSVAPERASGWVLNWLTLRQPYFEDQLLFLQKNKYCTVFLDEWYAIRQEKEGKTRSNLVCLSFDDGMLDNWVVAFPLARKYGIRFTLFVSPECVDPSDIVRPTLEDVWEGKARLEDLQMLGYCSWQELKIMQDSGIVDVQSHTMTHAKYISGPRLKGFYYGKGPLGLHATLNAFPEKRPFYPADASFNTLLPAGTPIFEEASAVVVHRQTIQPAFLQEIAALASTFELEQPEQREAYQQAAMDLYWHFAGGKGLIAEIEDEESFLTRIKYEIIGSKAVLESRLGKAVRFLCWPHGDNSLATHELAIKAGYLATTSGKLLSQSDQPDRIPRIGVDEMRNSRWLTLNRYRYKVASHYQQQPYLALSRVNDWRNAVLKKN